MIAPWSVWNRWERGEQHLDLELRGRKKLTDLKMGCPEKSNHCAGGELVFWAVSAFRGNLVFI